MTEESKKKTRPVETKGPTAKKKPKAPMAPKEPEVDFGSMYGGIASQNKKGDK